MSNKPNFTDFCRKVAEKMWPDVGQEYLDLVYEIHTTEVTRQAAELYADRRVEEAMRWIPVSERLPEEELFGGYLVVFKTIHGEEKICVATFTMETQHCFENSPKHPTFYAYPSSGHKIKATHWMHIPEL